MRWPSPVTQSTEATRHTIGTIVDGSPEPLGAIPTPQWVEIVEGAESFSLLYFDASGGRLTDTWHATLNDAPRLARSNS
jgi:hypothetical protein